MRDFPHLPLLRAIAVVACGWAVGCAPGGGDADEADSPADAEIRNEADAVIESRLADPLSAAEREEMLREIVPNLERILGRRLERVHTTVVRQFELDEELSQHLANRLDGLALTEIDLWKEHLRQPGTSPTELFQVADNPDHLDRLHEIVAEVLDEEDFARFAAQQHQRLARRIEREANREVTRLRRSLDLSEDQADRVFEIVVRSHDPSLLAATPTGSGDPPEVPPQDTSPEEEIRAILEAHQIEAYNEELRDREEAARRWDRRWSQPPGSDS